MDIPGDLLHLLLGHPAGLPDPVSKHPVEENIKGEDCDGNKGQSPVHVKKETQDEKQSTNVHDGVGKGGTDKVLRDGDVPDDP